MAFKMHKLVGETKLKDNPMSPNIIVFYGFGLRTNMFLQNSGKKLFIEMLEMLCYQGNSIITENFI